MQWIKYCIIASQFQWLGKCCPSAASAPAPASCKSRAPSGATLPQPHTDATPTCSYTWYFSAVILPIALLIVLAPITLYRYRKGLITPAMLKFSWRSIAWLGLLDTLYNIMSSIPVKAIGGTVTNVLSQVRTVVRSLVVSCSNLDSLFAF